MNQGLTAEVQTINQQMQSLHEAIMQIRSTHESILSITTSMRSASSRYGAASQIGSVNSRTSQHTSTSAAGRRQLRMEIAASQAQQTTLQQAEQMEFEAAQAQAQAQLRAKQLKQKAELEGKQAALQVLEEETNRNAPSPNHRDVNQTSREHLHINETNANAQMGYPGSIDPVVLIDQMQISDSLKQA